MLAQGFLGLFLFLLQCGVHVKACRVMLSTGLRRVRPNQHHLLLSTFSFMGGWSACLHSSVFLMVSGQWTVIIRRWHQLTIVCILCAVALVNLHVSALFGGSQLVTRFVSAAVISCGFSAVCRFNTSSKCSVYLLSCLSVSVMTSLCLIGPSHGLVFPANLLVISYSCFMFLLATAASQSCELVKPMLPCESSRVGKCTHLSHRCSMRKQAPAHLSPFT